jgi:hypothetical protein
MKIAEKGGRRTSSSYKTVLAGPPLQRLCCLPLAWRRWQPARVSGAGAVPARPSAFSASLRMSEWSSWANRTLTSCGSRCRNVHTKNWSPRGGHSFCMPGRNSIAVCLPSGSIAMRRSTIWWGVNMIWWPGLPSSWYMRFCPAPPPPRYWPGPYGAQTALWGLSNRLIKLVLF